MVGQDLRDQYPAQAEVAACVMNTAHRSSEERRVTGCCKFAREVDLQSSTFNMSNRAPDLREGECWYYGTRNSRLVLNRDVRMVLCCETYRALDLDAQRR